MEQPEQWRKYDDTYMVSDLGRVKRIYKNGREHYLTPVKRDAIDKALRVKMHNKYVSLRRLVWTTFNGKIPDGYGVVNKNRCHTMNEIYNLELMPIKQCIALNTASRRKPVIDLDRGLVYVSARDAAKYLYLTHSTIANYCKHKTLNPKYNLEYFDEDRNYRRTLRFIR